MVLGKLTIDCTGRLTIPQEITQSFFGATELAEKQMEVFGLDDGTIILRPIAAQSEQQAVIDSMAQYIVENAHFCSVPGEVTINNCCGFRENTMQRFLRRL